MALVKLETLYPNYKESAPEFADLKKFDVYTRQPQDDNQKVGSVEYLLMDEQEGQLRYFVIDTGFWIFGKRVLLPIGRTQISHTDKRIYVNGLTKEQVENLPDFDDLEKVDYDYEERTRNIYRRPESQPSNLKSRQQGAYSYQQDPDLFEMNEQNHPSLKLYQERLIADKHRQKTGEVTVGKRVETENAKVSVPVEKERVVIERSAPGSNKAVAPQDTKFKEGEVARIDVYEETPDIHKEAFVREEVNVKKVVDHETVNADEKVRREELDLDTQGRPVIKKGR